MGISIKQSPAKRTNHKDAKHGKPLVEDETYGVSPRAGGLVLSNLHGVRSPSSGQHVFTIELDASDVIRMLLNLRPEDIPQALAAGIGELHHDGYSPPPTADRVLAIVHALTSGVIQAGS